MQKTLIIFNKELNSFFGSLIGYVAIGFFLLLIGSLMWLIPSTSVLYSDYASMQILFDFGPYIIMILASSITMGLWSVEKNDGMMEVLLITPIKVSELILGKYLASLLIMFFALCTTIVYYLSMYYLANPVGNIDTSAIVTSYLGLFFLSSVFVSIGLLGASITKNQIVSFLISITLCMAYYHVFEMLSRLDVLNKYSLLIANFSGLYHYYSLSKGVIDSRDLIHFVSIIILSIFFVRIIIKKKK